MNNIIKEKMTIENLIYKIRGVEVMLDFDIASLYQVDTKRINEAVNRNKEKFPERYSFKITEEDLKILSMQNIKLNINTKTRTKPRAFTEQGLYMLATILKSKVATDVTIAIMDTFVKMRHYINYNKELLPNKIFLLEEKVDKNTKRINEIFDKFNSKGITKEYLFFENELFKSHYVFEKILDLAKEEIIIIDNYANKELLIELSKFDKKIVIVSKNMDNNLIKKYKAEFNNIDFIQKDIFHDRFIIIDRKILFSCGASFKDLGKKCFAINLMEEEMIINDILNKLK